MKNKLYLLYGDEPFLINNKINEIVQDESVVFYDVDTTDFNDIKEEIMSYSLFSSNKTVVCKNCNFLTSSSENKEYLNILGEILKNDFDNKLILSVNSKVDERKKVVKELIKLSTVFVYNKLNENDTINFIFKEFKKLDYKIDVSTLNYFYNYVGDNLDIIYNEIQKMDLYKDDKIITKEDINSISSKAIDNNIFELIDAISNKDIGRALNIYDYFLLVNEEEIKLISIIADYFRLIYQTKTLIDNDYSEVDISKELEVHPYRVKLARNSSISMEDAKKNLLKLFDLDVSIKTGTKNKKTEFRLYLLNL